MIYPANLTMRELITTCDALREHVQATIALFNAPHADYAARYLYEETWRSYRLHQRLYYHTYATHAE